MTESNPVLIPAAGDQPEIVDIGTIAAQNIVVRLGVEGTEDQVRAIKSMIADEINAMSSHFSLAFADVRNAYDIEVAKIEAAAADKVSKFKAACAAEVKQIKSTFEYVKANSVEIVVSALVVFVIGVVVGRFV